MTDIAREHHYTPRAHLKGWSFGQDRLNAYRLLVPSATYPVWEERSLRGLGKVTDLYTSALRSADPSYFEKWINEYVEDPAAAPLRRLRAGEQLAKADWDQLAIHIATLDLRTPAAFLRSKKRWEALLPDAMKESFADLGKKLKEGRPTLTALAHPQQPRIPLKVTTQQHPETGSLEVRAEIVAGRELWLYEIQRMLTSTADILKTHMWSTMRPYTGCAWFTTDDPVVRLHSHGNGVFDFGGGWGRHGAEIYLAISADVMIYTHIGTKQVEPVLCTHDITLLLQRMIALHAYRWVFASGQHHACRGL